MRPRTMWPLVVEAYRGLPAFQRERVWQMGFGSILEIKPFFVDPPLIQVIRDMWDRVSRTFLFPWGHMVRSLEDVARITGLRVDREAVTGVTYADYTDLTQQLLGLELFGQDDHERRMVRRVALLYSLGLAGMRQKADELLPAFVEWAAGLARATYGQDAEDTVRVDRDLRRFLVFFFGKMMFTTKGDDIHCRFLELLDDLTYAWGAALLAHTFADLSTGTGRETTVGRFVPFLQVWSYYCLPLGRATEVDPAAVPLARRWLPLVSTATYAFQLDVLRRHVRDFLALLVVEARARQLAAERLLKASEERYRCGRERAREQGRASAYSESILASSSQYERNVQDAVGAQRSTSSTYHSCRPGRGREQPAGASYTCRGGERFEFYLEILGFEHAYDRVLLDLRGDFAALDMLSIGFGLLAFS
ncbi:hypothetical protein Taro_037398 [Colocasia esculenta]|uniref:Aminotransferase-like plant mobile domain-containing protein n=1 Tax=Colocasia esculenta TaxID=4460 RepID=A0A843WJ59_COLES|nr:hypothetical protein [Colocasia esculenta]